MILYHLDDFFVIIFMFLKIIYNNSYLNYKVQLGLMVIVFIKNTITVQFIINLL